MTRPLLLDLFCGAGGASVGYSLAGFDIVGIDIARQPNYPFEFIQNDALAVLTNPSFLARFDALHASPPCQAFTPLRAVQAEGYADRHVDLIGTTRNALAASSLPWVIENVPQAPLAAPVVLCGSMFELPVRRHRAFESSFSLLPAPVCDHACWPLLWPDGFPVSISKARRAGGRNPRSPVVGVYGSGGGVGKDLATWKWAMETPWMQNRHEVAESIPPAYTRFVGGRLHGYL